MRPLPETIYLYALVGRQTGRQSRVANFRGSMLIGAPHLADGACRHARSVLLGSPVRLKLFLLSTGQRLTAMRDLAQRQAFAGVRTNSPEQSSYDSDLSCCAYGRGCMLFADNGFDAEQHLQPWLNDEKCMVDRYDVRLLLHDSAQITKSLHRRASSSQIDGSDDEAELDYERYRDLQPELRDLQPPVFEHTIP